MAYTLSYYQPVIRTTLHRPKWWRFWEKPRLIHRRGHERVIVHDVSQSTADFLIKHSPGILLDIVPNATMIQLEQGEQPYRYIGTIDDETGYAVNGLEPSLVMDYEKGFYAYTKGDK